MYNWRDAKKIGNFEDRVNHISDIVSWLDFDIKTNPTVLSSIKELQNELFDIEKSTSTFSRALKRDLLIDLDKYSKGLKGALCDVLTQYIEEYVVKMRVLFLFMLKHPHLFVDKIHDRKISDFDYIHHGSWRFFAKHYAFSSSPEVFVELCKNNNVLSHEEIFKLLIKLIDSFVSNVIFGILSEVAHRNDETKKEVTQKIRLQYSHASKSVDHTLLSKSKRAAIQDDFLNITKEACRLKLEKDFSEISNLDFHKIVPIVSLNLFIMADEEYVSRGFSSYVSLFLENQFQKSNANNLIKKENVPISKKQMIEAVVLDEDIKTSPLEPLPLGLKDEIKTYLVQKKNTSNLEKIASAIEKILQKFLTRKDVIRKQWFIEKVASYGSNCIDNDFFVLLEKYGFSCVDVNKSINEDSTEEEILQLFLENPISQELLSDPQRNKLTTLDALDTLERLEGESKKAHLLKKMSWYADMFQELGYSFDNKKKFISDAAEYSYSNPRLDKEIKKILNDVIVKNREEEHKFWRGFYVFDMTNWWRILLYKKGIIHTLWSHDSYERHIKNRF